MKFKALAISIAIISNPAWGADVPPIYQKPDPASRFSDAKLHVKELMKAGQYKEAAEYMVVYQTLACEAAEQQAGRSIEEGSAICAAKYKQAGIGTNAPHQQQSAPEPLSSNTLAPGITVMPRTLPGSSTLLDGSTPSLFVFDPRTDPAQTGSRTSPQSDPWTGGH